MPSDLGLILKFLGKTTYTNTEDNKVIIWDDDKGSHDSELKHNLALPATHISWCPAILFIS